MRNTIDGNDFRDMMLMASAAIEMNKQHINELNVFPVPDGDTGTNMSLTMSTAAAELRKTEQQSIGVVANTAAGALLRGARGNSGVILSLLFRGFAKALKDKQCADGFDFAMALNEGVEAAYKAVMKPAEGTILTVSRVSAAHALQTAVEISEPELILRETIACAKTALAETVHQNPVLKKAGVIDAGAKGYIVILEGMLASLMGEEPPAAEDAETELKDRADFSDYAEEDINFTYCTEFIVSRTGCKDPLPLRDFLSGLGDSLVLVDDEEIIKVHVHTDNPGKALEAALEYGTLFTVKIENMREQHTEKLREDMENAAFRRTIAKPEKKYGFVAVSAGEGISSVFRDLGADGIIQGGQTMNPSTEDILLEIDRTPSEIVFVLPNNKNIIMAAQQCIPLSDKQVIVIPTKTMPQGVTALMAMDATADTEDNIGEMGKAVANVKTMLITYAARDSEYDGIPIKEGDYLALNDNTLFDTDSDIGALLTKLALSVKDSPHEFITIYAGADTAMEEAEKVSELFACYCPEAEINLLDGGQPVYYYMIAVE